MSSNAQRSHGAVGHAPSEPAICEESTLCQSSARPDLEDRTHRAVGAVCDGSVVFGRITPPCCLTTRCIAAENGASDRQRQSVR